MKQCKAYTKESGLVETNNFKVALGLTWHREDGPAFVKYLDNGNISWMSYCINGQKHRLNGPAYIEYDGNGNVEFASYWINGNSYSKEQYDKELLKLKVQSL